MLHLETWAVSGYFEIFVYDTGAAAASSLVIGGLKLNIAARARMRRLHSFSWRRFLSESHLRFWS